MSVKCGSCGSYVSTVGRSDLNVTADRVLCEDCGTWIYRVSGTPVMGA